MKGGRDRRLVCITDVPTPYRNHLFAALHKELAGRGIRFEVWFMAARAPDRFWTFDAGPWCFEHAIARGIHPAVNGWAYHLNPGILWRLVASPPRWILLGGAWGQPTTFLSALCGRLRRSLVIFWSEANRDATTRRSGPIAAARRAVLRLADAFAVPGSIARSTIGEDWSVGDRRFVPLPNVVDECVFSIARPDAAERARRLRQFGVPPNARVFFWPARLHEPSKGIINFLDAVRGELTGNDVIIIAGEGPDRARIEQWLQRHALAGRVRLLGFQAQAHVVTWLSVADVLLLPSLRDPNPLAVIEGLWAGLPLILSRRCGNWPEALPAGDNGWLIDPAAGESMALAMRDAVRAPAHRLAQMGETSRRIAAQHFATDRSVRVFADALLSLDAAPSMAPA